MTSEDARRVAAALRRRGLEAPARLLADAHRPLGPLLSDLGIAVGPLLGAAGAVRAGRMLSGPDALDDVIDALDRSEEPRDRAD
jgi:hypothetical protein